MKLVNLELDRPYNSGSIKGLGYEWDLHNCADCLGFDFSAVDSTFSMTWDASSPQGTTWGNPENDAKGCKLIFRNVNFIHMSPRDAAYPRNEDWCVSNMSKVIPNTTEFRYQDYWDEGDEFNLLFEFHSERTLEIGAESVELRAVK